jgi:hypothetical protein
MKGIFFQIYDNKKIITKHSNEWLLEIYRLAAYDQICPRNLLQTADSDIIVSLHLVILSNLWFHQLAVSSIGCFVNWLFHQLVVS